MSRQNEIEDLRIARSLIKASTDFNELWLISDKSADPEQRRNLVLSALQRSLDKADPQKLNALVSLVVQFPGSYGDYLEID